MNMRRSIALLLLSGVAMLAIACSSKPAKLAPQEHKVLIQDFKFQPADLKVNVGDTVVFTNADMMPHNAVSEGKFHSDKIEQGKSWKYVATEKGTFDYICTYHPNMKGHLVVR
jgi:plastocyanin